MENQIEVLNNNIVALQKEMEIIKKIVMPDEELTDWAKEQLAIARNTPESEYISLEEMGKIIQAK